MKKILTLVLLTIQLTLSAQIPAEHEEAVKLFVERYNLQQFESIYDAFSPSFKEKIPLTAVRMTLSGCYEAYGKVKEPQLTKSENGKYSYLMICENGAFEVTFHFDENNKTDGFKMVPAKKPKTNPDKVFATDNLGKSDLDKSINTEIQKFLNSGEFVGMSVAVISNGTVTYYNYGEIEAGSGKLANENSIYDIGSITKTYTASIISQLVEAHKITLEDTLGKFVMGLDSSVGAIKVVQLLNHTSGLPSMPVPPASDTPTYDPFENYTTDQLINDLKSIKLQSKSGENFSYSNLGFACLGLIIEKVKGKKYEEVIANSIFKPLKMNTSTFVETTIDNKNMTKGSIQGKSVTYARIGAFKPAGGIKSNLADMVKYAKSVAGKDLLVKKITFKQPTGVNVGLAWLNRESEGSSIYFHNGGTTGYRSFMGMDDKRQKTVIILSNSSADVTQLGFALLKLM